MATVHRGRREQQDEECACGAADGVESKAHYGLQPQELFIWEQPRREAGPRLQVVEPTRRSHASSRYRCVNWCR